MRQGFSRSPRREARHTRRPQRQMANRSVRSGSGSRSAVPTTRCWRPPCGPSVPSTSARLRPSSATRAAAPSRVAAARSIQNRPSRRHEVPAPRIASARCSTCHDPRFRGGWCLACSRRGMRVGSSTGPAAVVPIERLTERARGWAARIRGNRRPLARAREGPSVPNPALRRDQLTLGHVRKEMRLFASCICLLSDSGWAMRYPSIAQPHELAAFEPTSKNVYLLRDAAWPPLEALLW